MLSQQQVDQFRTFGFVTLRDHLAPDEIARLRQEFDHAMTVSYVGNEFDGSSRHWIPMMGPAAPTFGRLAGDERFLGAARQLTGHDVMLLAVDANRYVGDTFWHSDGGPGGGAKFVFYLEPVRADTGALRVIPMSQVVNGAPDFPEAFRDAVQARVQEANDADDYASIPAVPLESDPGDVVVFDPNCYHASVGGPPGRPMCTVTFLAQPKIGDDLLDLLEVVEEANITRYGATDVSQVLDRAWFAAQDWGPGHAEVVDTWRRLGRLDRATAAGR